MSPELDGDGGDDDDETRANPVFRLADCTGYLKQVLLLLHVNTVRFHDLSSEVKRHSVVSRN